MKLGVLTTGRQDWGILRSTCRAVSAEGHVLELLVGGMHLSARYGATARFIREEGFVPAAELRWLSDEGNEPAAAQAAEATRHVADALERIRPDALVLVGDRFETAAAALAATLVRVPLIHLHGGEESAGAFDNALRHAITKLSHLHLVSHPAHAARVIAMGEDPAAVHVVGAPGLDNARRDDLPTRAELEAIIGIPLVAPVVVVTLHPATLAADPEAEVAAVVAALDAVEATYVVTLPNADPGSEHVRGSLERAVRWPRRKAVSALGERAYWGLLRVADALLGNSSSALIEAPVLRLPAVNVGERQKGRTRGANVLDAPADGEVIAAALRRALTPAFRASLPEGSPFGDGRSAERITAVLRTWRPSHPPVKAPVRISA